MSMMTLMVKDIRLVLADRKALSILLAMPIIITTILTMALAGVYEGNMSMEKVDIAVVKAYGDEDPYRAVIGKLEALGIRTDIMEGDRDRLSEDLDPEAWFFEGLLERPSIKEMISYGVMSEEEAMRALEEDKVAAVVILPDNYRESAIVNLMTPFKCEVYIRVIPNPQRTSGPKVVEAVMEAYAENLTGMTQATKMWFKETLLSGDGRSFDEAFINRMDKELRQVVTTEVSESGAFGKAEWLTPNDRPPLTSGMSTSLGMMAMFALFTAGYGSHFLYDDYKNRTLDRVLVVGVKPMTILFGNIGAVFVITVLQMLVLACYGMLVLGVDYGSMGQFAIAVMAYALTISAFSAFLGTIAYKVKNDKLPRMFQGFIFQLLALLGGSYMPVELMPEAFRWFSQIPLNGVFLKLGIRVARDYGLHENMWLFGNLLLQALVFAALAWWLFVGEVERVEDAIAT